MNEVSVKLLLFRPRSCLRGNANELPSPLVPLDKVLLVLRCHFALETPGLRQERQSFLCDPPVTSPATNQRTVEHAPGTAPRPGDPVSARTWKDPPHSLLCRALPLAFGGAQ